jgi:RNA polymerase sigma-70 factor (ECF subfamily)
MQQELPSRTDDQLMESVRDDGCPKSFETLVERWRQPIFRLCYRMIFSREDAEDITQDVFARLFQNRLRYKPTAQFKTYLWSIAINRCRDFLRSTKRQNQRLQELTELRLHDSAADANPNDLERVRVALARLSPIYREVVVLRHYEELKFVEIAELLQIPVGTVASRMSKALKLVGDRLADLNTKRDVG